METTIFKLNNKDYYFTTERQKPPHHYMSRYILYDGEVGNEIIFKRDLILPISARDIEREIDKFLIRKRKEKLEKLR